MDWLTDWLILICYRVQMRCDDDSERHRMYDDPGWCMMLGDGMLWDVGMGWDGMGWDAGWRRMMRGRTYISFSPWLISTEMIERTTTKQTRTTVSHTALAELLCFKPSYGDLVVCFIKYRRIEAGRYVINVIHEQHSKRLIEHCWWETPETQLLKPITASESNKME